ncbi:MAG: tRNA (adenosine(37)-N6)-threonylcarbamoyltransferase complex dimerization subunit type 1 TsaB [Gammaproteobacteria bacterium]|nr:tRNA (adenosine(37)-N6)-threonylcarbamoyltransferase complex dimerization subunit type 1 TsaB [Gammaproteobacteria bacterium]MYH84681.1 tRNA (adenosine(37)-N6)-threonylcarbamoyltransferase complex dimerization subunit type 1 TsaB [Gammaproteobacteria bacterium]MYK04933.1 tRNA (adenosine(37)-N6)-threonylcarbamoyltransferase complex dimerization subunit type 1 TsaB [Gammaproteobacteria bacterium]
MASILILNTALERACALVWRDAGHVARHAPEARQSAQTILQLAREAFDEAGLKRADAVAVVAGPGSFTGTRIGVAVAQGLCAAWDAPAVPLSTLALTAAAAQRRHDADAYLVGLKSRADELYFGCYLRAGNGMELHGAEQAGALADLRMDSVEAQDLLAVGDGWPDAGSIENHFGIRLESEPVTAAVEDIDLVTMARALWERGNSVGADLLRPNYVNEAPQYREQPGSG